MRIISNIFKVMVAVNGVEVVHCDSLVREAMSHYWKKNDGHFVCVSNDIMSYTVSKTVDSLKAKPPRLPIMME